MSQEVLDKVGRFIKDRQLFPPKTPLLVAVSGGVDSMVAWHILSTLDFPVQIAHCNFKLRGEAADEDEALVSREAKSQGLEFHHTSFETAAYADKHKVSIQEAARDLRYQWLEEVRKSSGTHFIITAHHQQDNAETMLFNLARNTGWKGMRGIPPKREHIARPLLCLSKQEILDYASAHKIKFNEDASNASDKYSRNAIRHHVLPELEKIHPNAIVAIDQYSAKVAEADALINERLQQIRSKILLTNRQGWELKFGFINHHAAGRTILFDILKDFGFNEEQVVAVHALLNGQPGIEFHSETHRVVKDRNSLYIVAQEASEALIRSYDQLPNQIEFNAYKIQVREVPIDKVTLRNSPNYGYLDLDKITFPITIRNWKAGDYFYPFGLTKDRSDKPGKKKLSKYFKDQKISVIEKEEVPVLFSGEHLIWLVGHRIDHRFRVTPETRRVLKMKIISN